MKPKEFKDGGLGKALALGQSMYEDEEETDIGKLLKEQQTSQEILNQRNEFFKVPSVEDK